MTPALLLQYLLPHRLLSRLVYRATRWRLPAWKNLLIGQVVRRYGVDLDEAEEPDRTAYPHFNAFFTRALKAHARHFDVGSGKLLSPADGRISQIGAIDAGRIIQAKGRDYGATELLADAAAAEVYREGAFVTLYLAPRDYHRVHMPLAGELVETVQIPGRLFSVAPFTVAAIPGLFARNERLVCHFIGSEGPFAVVLVGAMLVSSIATVWAGLEIPPHASRVLHKDYRGLGVRLAQGAELGRFNMGSTVVLLLPAATVRLDAGLTVDQVLRVGQPIGRLCGHGTGQ